jgi:hypothetical protein
MATATKIKLSGSTDGKGIKVAATSPLDGSDTAIHTTGSGTTDYDLVTLFAVNTDSADRELFIGWGGTTDPDNLIRLTIPARAGLVLVTADLPLQNSGAIVAAASAANVVVVYGYVNRLDY